MKLIKLNQKNNSILLREFLHEQGIRLSADCGGNGTCGKCKVRFVTDAPEPTIAEWEKMSRKELEAGWRLACKTLIPGIQNTNSAIDIEEEEKNSDIEAEREEMNSIIEVEIEDIYLNIEETGCSPVSKKETQMGLLTTSDNITKDNIIKVALDIGTTTLAAAVVDSERTETKPMPISHKVTNEEVSAITMNHQRIHGSDVISRIHAANNGYGKELQTLVIKDIEELLRKLRVDCCFDSIPDRLEMLDKHFRTDGQLISDRQIELFISCNTTMGHILQGYSCESLGRAPYTPVDLSYHKYLCESVDCTKENSGNDAEQNSGNDAEQNSGNSADKNQQFMWLVVMHMLPGISTFVGADIVSGLVACDMEQSEKINLFVDIGTNAEMAIGNRNRILVTSAAAGPAFEGGNISAGMPGISGAISKVSIDVNLGAMSSITIQENNVTSSLTIEGNCETIRDKNKVLCKHIRAIDNEEPTGICGSGVLELVYELKKNGLIDETGLLVEEFFESGFPVYEVSVDKDEDSCEKVDAGKGFCGNNSESGNSLCKDIIFTQKDIREVQQAKAAIRTGIELLIKEYGTTYDQIDKVYLAGSFGQHMNVQKAVGIGLIPAELEDKVVAVGNTSLAGTVLAVKGSLNQEEASAAKKAQNNDIEKNHMIKRFLKVIDISEEIILADHKEFPELYLKYMYLN